MISPRSFGGGGGLIIRVLYFVVTEVVAVDVVKHHPVADGLDRPEVVRYLAVSRLQFSEYFYL